MRLDPAVARRKFAREVERVEAQRTVLQGWGCFIVNTIYPHVDAVFMPRKPMRLLLPMNPRQTQGLIFMVRSEPQFVPVELPSLAARAFGVRADLAEFDQRAPGVSFHDPFTWEPLPYALLPLGQHIDEHGNAMRVVLDGHPGTKRPFLCMRGTREYHEHPQHSGDEWALYRGQYGLFATLHTVWRTCVEGARPNLALVPNVGPQIQWEVEKVA